MNCKFSFLLKIAFLFLFLINPLWAKDYKIVTVFSGGAEGYLDMDGDLGGLARKVALLKKIQKSATDQKAVFFALDSGNTVAPFYLSRFNQGKILLSSMEATGYVGMAPGFQEFAYGQNNFLSMAGGQVPFLCTNIYKGKTQAGKRFIILDKGMKIGIFGLTSPTIKNRVSANILKGLSIKDPIKEAQKVVDELVKKGVSLIICVANLELEEAYELARKVTKINLIIRNTHHSKAEGGVQKFSFFGTQERAIIVAPEKRNHSVGMVTFNLKGDDKKATLFTAEIKYQKLTKDLPEDSNTKKAIADYKQAIQKKIGTSLLPFSPAQALPTKFSKKGFAKMVAAILRDQFHTEVAILPLKFFNEKEIQKLAKKGELTYEDVERLFFGQAKISVFTLSGGAIASIVNSQKADVPLAFSGVEKKGGSVLIQGVKVRGGDHYWVASVKYLSAGNTGYPQFGSKANVTNQFRINKDFSIHSKAKGLELALQDSFNAYANGILKEIGRGPNPKIFNSELLNTMNKQEPTYLFIFDNLRIMYSETKASVSSANAALVSDTRASARNEQTLEVAGRFIFLRHTPSLLWENKLGFHYAQTKLEGQPKNTSIDDLYLGSDMAFLAWGFDLWKFRMAPSLSLKYDTELEKDSGKNMERIVYFSLGASGVSAGPFTKLKLGALGKADFTNKNSFQYGLLASIDFSKKFLGVMTIDSDVLLYYIPNQKQDQAGDLKIRLEWNTIIKMPFWKEFNFVIEFRVFAFQAKKTGNRDFETNTAISVGITYHKAWKFIYEPFFGQK